MGVTRPQRDESTNSQDEEEVVVQDEEGLESAVSSLDESTDTAKHVDETKDKVERVLTNGEELELKKLYKVLEDWDFDSARQVKSNLTKDIDLKSIPEYVATVRKVFLTTAKDPWSTMELLQFVDSFGEGIDFSEEVKESILYFLKKDSFVTPAQIKRMFGEGIDFRIIEGYDELILDLVRKKLEVVSRRDIDVGYYETAMNALIGLIKHFGEGIDFKKIEGFEDTVRRLFQVELSNLHSSDCKRIKKILAPNADFSDMIGDGILDRVRADDIETAVVFNDDFGENDGYFDFVRERTDISPTVFINLARRKHWIEEFGEEAVEKFLSVLPKTTDERRNAFKHNEYDRTSRLFVGLAYLAKEEGKKFTLDDIDFEIITDYVKRFGLSIAPRIYEYFRSIKLLEKGALEKLPDEQIEDGITSIDALERRIKNLENVIYSEESLTDLKGFGKLEIDLLNSATGVSTHVHSGSGCLMEEMMECFSEDYEDGNIDDVPEGYKSAKLKVSEATISFNAENVQEDFDVLSREILESVENQNLLGNLQKEAMRGLGQKIKELKTILDKKSNPFLEDQLEEFERLAEVISKVDNLDMLMEELLSVDKKTAEKYGLISIMRRIVFHKVFEKNLSPGVIQERLVILREGISGKSILAVKNIVDHIVKAHVLNVDKNNEEGYWQQSTWQKIRTAKKGKNQVNLLKAFSPHIDKLREEANNFEIEEIGNDFDVTCIPDRGFIGEMSGYLADACYTAEYPLLAYRPNLVPEKFVISKEGELDLFGSALIFELEDDKGEKVLLVRAFNVPAEDSINIGALIEDYLDRMAELAKRRGAKKVVVPGIDGAISNYTMTINHMHEQYIDGKKPIKLGEKFDFNDYDLTRSCYVAREV